MVSHEQRLMTRLTSKSVSLPAKPVTATESTIGHIRSAVAKRTQSQMRADMVSACTAFAAEWEADSGITIPDMGVQAFRCVSFRITDQSSIPATDN